MAHDDVDEDEDEDEDDDDDDDECYDEDALLCRLQLLHAVPRVRLVKF